jgi:hypothetical protein
LLLDLWSGVNVNREYNPKQLKDVNRLCVYRCTKCHRIAFVPFNVKEQNFPTVCKGCKTYLDGDRDIMGDSWTADQYEGVRFTVDGVTELGKPRLLVWFRMECRDCGQMTWIAWRGRWFDYSTCICHEAEKAAEPTPKPAPKPKIDPIIIEEITIPSELVAQFKDYCFEHDVGKKDVIVHALKKMFDAKV